MDIEKTMREPAVRLTTEAVRLNSLLAERFAPAHEHTGLSRLELAVLVAVTAAPTAPTVAQIGRAIGHARQAVQKAANALENRGLLTSAANPRHKQARLLSLSEAGQELANEVFERGNTIARVLSAELGSKRLSRLCDELESLREMLDQNRASER